MTYTEQIRECQISLGTKLRWDVVDGEGRLLLKKGSTIESEKHLGIIRAKGSSYRIEESVAEKQEGPGRKKKERIVPFMVIDEATRALESLLSKPLSVEGFPLKIENIARLLQQACNADADAALSTILMDSKEGYPVKHSVDTAIVSELVAKYQGWSDSERHSILCAALTQNIAIIALQEKLHFQEAPLSESQSRAIKGHPAAGVEMLKLCGVEDEKWLGYVLQHHEAGDGSGYPKGLMEKEISPYATLISMADFYCAKVTGRDYRPPMTTLGAIQFVFQGKDSRVDKTIAEHFIKVLGIFLPGTFVRLKNGEVAVVIHQGEKVNTPLVNSIVKKNGELFSVPQKRDSSDVDYAIEAALLPSEINVQIKRYQLWGYGTLH